ncbi:hypothetical protein Tco_0356308 [Tanacetum coccineum]
MNASAGPVCTRTWTGKFSPNRSIHGIRAYFAKHFFKLETWKVEGTVDITEFFRKLKCVCHWADPFKDLKWSNVPGVMFSSLSEWMTPFRVVSWIISGPVRFVIPPNLVQADLVIVILDHYSASNGAALILAWFSALMFSSLIMPRFGTSRICDGNLRMVAISQSNLQAILSYSVVSCSTLYDQGLCWKEIL